VRPAASEIPDFRGAALFCSHGRILTYIGSSAYCAFYE
jgi:hypothetical protein